MSSDIEKLARAIRTVGDGAGPVSQALDRARLSAQRLSSAVPRTESAGAAAGALYSAAGFCQEASRSLASFSDGCQAFANRLANGGGGGTGGSAGGAAGGSGGEEGDGSPRGVDAPARSFRGDDRAATDAWARAAGIHGGDLSGEQLDAVTGYTGTDYMHVNAGLRGQPEGAPVELTDQCRAIDAAMKPLPEDIQLIRGTERSWLPPAYQGNPKGVVGRAISDPGYLSATARGFDEDPPMHSGDDRLLMRVPAGKGALYVDPISRVPGEDEIMLSRDNVLYVQSAVQRGDQWFFKVEVVSRAWAEGLGLLVHR